MKWFYNMKIGAKLVTAFVLVAIIAGIVGIVGIMNIRTIDKSDTELYENMTVPISHMALISTNFQMIRVNTRDIILANTPEDISNLEDRIKQRRAEIDQNSLEFDKKILSKTVRDAYNTFLETRKAYSPYLEKLIQLAKDNKDDEASALLISEGMTKVVNDEQAAIEKLVNMKINDAKEKSDANTRAAYSATIAMIIFVLAGMILAIILGLFIASITSNPIRKLSAAAELIAEGDLNIELDIHTKDEVGHLAASFRKMADKLNDVMSSISSASEQVASGSKQVSDSSMALSQGATEQASSIEELTASLEEISSQTRQNAEYASQANELAEYAKSNAVQGNVQMKEMLKAMDEINDSSSNISKIIKVIDEIAFQTNILALNAAVEAARAGQHGKGFAVVAEEVRNLAARSANAAKETTALIEGSIKKVEGGTKIANQTAEALNSIVDGVAKVASLVGDIAIASNEQASGIAQINQGILQVSQVVQTNSATSEESAAASEELASQAAMLKEQVGRFKLRKSNFSSFSHKRIEDINPEIVRLLEHMNDRKKSNYLNEPHAEAASAKPKKIDLNDKEFGKYL